MSTERAISKAEQVEAWMKGKAPMIDKENYKISLIKLLNWHNEFSDLRELKKLAVSHYKSNDAAAYALSQATDEETRQIGILCQYKDALQEKDQIKLAGMISKLCEKYKKELVLAEPAAQKETKVVFIDKVAEEANKIAEKIDKEIDDLFTLKSDGKFDVEVYLENQKPTAAVCVRMMTYFRALRKELHEVVANKDEQLAEGYTAYPRPRVKRILHSFIEPMWDKLERLSKKAKAERKPRKKKEKPASALVKSLQYMKECKELKLTSVDPKKIIGASQVWLYNTKYKKLTVLVADSGSGFTVKGTTIYGFSVDESKTKVVRKPELVLSEITKRKLAFHMKQMKTTEQVANGRVNEDTLILAV
jgi:hypothetical protein